MTLLAEGLAGRGHKVDVITLVRTGHFKDQLKSAGVRVHDIGRRFRFDPRGWIRVRRVLREILPDVLQSYLFSANTLARLPGVVPPGTKIVVSERCVDSWKSRWQLWLDQRLAKRADAMTVNSASVRDFYAELTGLAERIHIIRNGLPKDSQPRDPGWIREQLNLPDHLRLVGYAGRLAEQKRVMDIVWAFQLLHQLVDDVHLVVIGDGPQREYLEQFGPEYGMR